MTTCSIGSATTALVVFARYPEAGRCKTRLIPQLGAEGAADLHHEMVEYTLNWARKATSDDSPIALQVHYFGGDESSMRAAFGEDLCFEPQAAGDLGAKLQAAAERCRSLGFSKILFVGTDCPQLNHQVAEAAEQSLDEHEVCFAPATDGGYTLLGLRLDNERLEAVFQALFEEVPWGTENVLSESLARLEGLSPLVRILATLEDVDEPEDLEVWHARFQGSSRAPSPALSVIVPCLGEEPGLSRTLTSACGEEDVEVIVVGAGDSRRTVESCVRQRAQFVQATEACRAQQMQCGVEHARGERILFLHADTILPAGYKTQVLETLEDASVALGAFTLALDSTGWRARWVERGVRYRASRFGMPYGDQALFAWKRTLQDIGGVPAQAIMEDYELVRRLKRVGQVQIVDACVESSTRRWESLGYLKTTVINQMMIIGYHAGISIDALARFYRGK